MRMTLTWRATLALVIGSAIPGCLPPGGDGDGDGDLGWFEFGHLGPDEFPDGILVADPPFDPLEAGDAVDMVQGGQGLVMLAFPIRGGDFVIDPSATTASDDYPKWPELEGHIDVEGHNTGLGGHFWRIANYPVFFEPTDEGDYAFFFLTVLVPDESSLTDLEGRPAHLEATLDPADYEAIYAPIDLELDFVIGALPE